MVGQEIRGVLIAQGGEGKVFMGSFFRRGAEYDEVGAVVYSQLVFRRTGYLRLFLDYVSEVWCRDGVERQASLRAEYDLDVVCRKGLSWLRGLWGGSAFAATWRRRSAARDVGALRGGGVGGGVVLVRELFAADAYPARLVEDGGVDGLAFYDAFHSGRHGCACRGRASAPGNAGRCGVRRAQLTRQTPPLLACRGLSR